MEIQAYKQRRLAHCLAMAELDPEYAIYAAGWYEALEPWYLENLQRKVRQEVARRQANEACSAR